MDLSAGQDKAKAGSEGTSVVSRNLRRGILQQCSFPDTSKEKGQSILNPDFFSFIKNMNCILPVLCTSVRLLNIETLKKTKLLRHDVNYPSCNFKIFNSVSSPVKRTAIFHEKS